MPSRFRSILENCGALKPPFQGIEISFVNFTPTSNLSCPNNMVKEKSRNKNNVSRKCIFMYCISSTKGRVFGLKIWSHRRECVIFDNKSQAMAKSYRDRKYLLLSL